MKEYRIWKVFSKELNREKRVYIYLPRSYHKSDKHYPVLYMHDGHNLFDEKTSYAGASWGILESYTEQADIPEVIIIGVEPSDNERGNELVPYEFTYQDGTKQGGDADKYLDFITKTLKPLVDETFRTYQSPKNTGIMGSSFGGVNSTYAALKYGDYFTRFGCVSNAYYYGGFFPKLKELANISNVEHVKKFYMDVGTNETSHQAVNKLYIDSNIEMYEILKRKIPENRLRFDIIEGAIHHETAWEKRFPEIVKYLFND